MKNSKSKLMMGVKSLCGLALLLAGLAATSQAQVVLGQPWTTIGAAGTVDDGEVTYTGPLAYLESDGAVLRYNVVAVEGPRTPDEKFSQKEFRIAFVFLVEPGTQPTPTEMAAVERLRDEPASEDRSRNWIRISGRVK